MPDALTEYDGILFGNPHGSGVAVAQLKAFMDSTGGLCALAAGRARR